MIGSVRRSPTQVVLVALVALTVIPATVYVATILPDLSLASAMLILLLEVVVVALLSNLSVAIVAAVGAVMLANWYLVPPQHTFFVNNTDDIVALFVFVLSAVGASIAVQTTLRSMEAAARNRVEADLLRESLEVRAQESDPSAMLARVAGDFGLDSVRLTDATGEVVAGAGDMTEPTIDTDESPDHGFIEIELPDGYLLTAVGPAAMGRDEGLLTSMGTAAVRSHEAKLLAADAGRAGELEAADSARAALLASVGHDLRTPIAAISVSAGALGTDPPPADEEARALVDNIAQSAHRLDDLVANLLDMSRLEAGRMLVHRQAVDVEEALADAALAFRGAAIELRVPADVPAADADPGLLERVLWNLLSNALRYDHSGKPVVLSARRTAQGVALVVRDHGPGMSEAQLREPFTPFRSAGDRSTGGVGLGLAIADGFTRAMGGRLAAEPAVGGGLAVTCELGAA